jgi:hypothetical protein
MRPSVSDFEWAGALVGSWAIQVPNRVVGQVRRVCVIGGVMVVEFEEGHTFHAVQENFIQLTEREVLAYRDMQANVRMVVGALAKRAVDAGMRQGTFEVLCGAALQAQLRAFGARPTVSLTKATDD